VNPADRVAPYALVLGTIAPERFPVLREGIAAAGRDPRDRDAFLMVREVVELLRELEPEAGLGKGIATMAAFLHQSYLYWMDGEPMVTIEVEALERALAGEHPPPGPQLPAPSTMSSSYIQLPPLRVWGIGVEGGPAEPLDGWFVSPSGESLSLLAVFGIHPGRAGFTAVEVVGPRPGSLERADGSALFSAALPGAAQAGLASIVGAEELLELAWRLRS
jgi:hypothetical protein